MQEPTITSRHNPRLKQAAALRDRRERRATGRLLVDGARETFRAIEAGVRPVEAFVDVDAHGDRIQAAISTLEATGVPIHRVTSEPFEKLAYGQRADGVVLVAEAELGDLSGLSVGDRPLLLLVEGVEKPGNLGAMLRTADGVGVDGVIVIDPRVDLFNPNVIRASVGAVFQKQVVVASVDDARRWLGERGVSIYAARPDAELLYTEADCTGACALLVGSEAEGLTDSWGGDQVQAVRLPMHGVADSLNVSTAAAVLMYEARRQRDAAQ